MNELLARYPGLVALEVDGATRSKIRTDDGDDIFHPTYISSFSYTYSVSGEGDSLEEAIKLAERLVSRVETSGVEVFAQDPFQESGGALWTGSLVGKDGISISVHERFHDGKYWVGLSVSSP